VLLVVLFFSVSQCYSLFCFFQFLSVTRCFVFFSFSKTTSNTEKLKKTKQRVTLRNWKKNKTTSNTEKLKKNKTTSNTEKLKKKKQRKTLRNWKKTKQPVLLVVLFSSVSQCYSLFCFFQVFRGTRCFVFFRFSMLLAVFCFNYSLPLMMLKNKQTNCFFVNFEKRNKN
jgi:hypothetical protein